MTQKSRYRNTLNFEADPRGNTSFKGVRPRDIPRLDGIIEHTVTGGDRLDSLANEYFEDSHLWYRLGDTNWGYLHSPDMVTDMVTNDDPLKDPSQNPTTDPLGREDRVGGKIIIPGRRQ